ncbi:MAG TPA: hypothetical protein VJI70_04175 [Candidatus Paceibacterota bacterium]
MSEYEGAFKLLAAVPVWMTALFVAIMCVAIPFVLADRTTGLFFNVSYSGVVGDLCLIIVILIGVTVIQRGALLPVWFSGMWPQVLWSAVCVTVGIILVTMTTPWPTETWPDRYHNFVTVPIFLFLLPLMVLTIIYNGNRVEMVMSCLLVAIWGSFVLYDFRTERMNQPEYVTKKFGLQFQNGRIVKVPYRINKSLLHH